MKKHFVKILLLSSVVSFHMNLSVAQERGTYMAIVTRQLLGNRHINQDPTFCGAVNLANNTTRGPLKLDKTTTGSTRVHGPIKAERCITAKRTNKSIFFLYLTAI